MNSSLEVFVKKIECLFILALAGVMILCLLAGHYTLILQSTWLKNSLGLNSGKVAHTPAAYPSFRMKGPGELPLPPDQIPVHKRVSTLSILSSFPDSLLVPICTPGRRELGVCQSKVLSPRTKHNDHWLLRHCMLAIHQSVPPNCLENLARIWSGVSSSTT